MRYSNSPIEENGTSIIDFCFKFVSPSKFEVSIKHCLLESEDSSSKMSAVFGYVTFFDATVFRRKPCFEIGHVEKRKKSARKVKRSIRLLDWTTACKTHAYTWV